MANKIIDYISGVELNGTPEEIQATQPFSKILVENYGYPKEMIQTRPQYRVKARPSDTKKEYPVDIAVFTSADKKEEDPYMIIECKKKNRKDGRSQLEDYLRLSKAYLGAWYNGNEILYLRKYEQNGRVDFKEIPNLPLYGQNVDDIGLFKRKDLKKTHNLKNTFNNIRNYLAANNTGQTLDTELLPQLINIIFCKIYDERYKRGDSLVDFRAGINEDQSSISKRIQYLFIDVKKKYPDVFDDNDKITLSDNSIAHIVGELQQYCLMESERDVIADAFEMFIGPSLRGPQGQFFTPRNVVKLLLSMTDPGQRDKIVDPACGSGGFLVEALKYVWAKVNRQCEELNWPEKEIFAELQEVAIKNFNGIDKENFLSKTSKAYMALLGDGRGGIFCENSLDNPTNWSIKAKNTIIDGKYNVVLTNPPYGSKLKIDDKTILRRYELGYKWKLNKDGELEKTNKELSDQTPQVLFIEKCLALLQVGGRLGIVAPESMFCNPSHKYIMKYVEKHARINAIISMPEELFQPHTHAKTCAVLMTKLAEDEEIDLEHKIFMAVAKWCGHDSRGLEVPYDDIPAIQERYEKYVAGETLSYDHLGFTVKQADIVNNIYLPIYYNPEIKDKLESLKKDYELVVLGDLIKDGVISVSTGDEVGKLAYGTGTIPFVRTSDIANWEIKLDPKQGLEQAIYDGLKERQDVQAEDILMVKDGTYLVGTCAMISSADTKIVYQSHLYKLRCRDKEKMNPYLLLALLSSPIVKEQIRSKQFTQDIIDTLGRRIYELVLPIPKNKNERETIIKQVKDVFKKRNEAKKIMRDTLLNMTPIHNFNENENFLTLL